MGVGKGKNGREKRREGREKGMAGPQHRRGKGRTEREKRREGREERMAGPQQKRDCKRGSKNGDSKEEKKVAKNKNVEGKVVGRCRTKERTLMQDIKYGSLRR